MPNATDTDTTRNDQTSQDSRDQDDYYDDGLVHSHNWASSDNE